MTCLKYIFICLFILLTAGLDHASAQQASFLLLTGGGDKYIKPVGALWGLQWPGLATSTTGCLGVNSAGWVSPSGSPCGSGTGGSGTVSTSTVPTPGQLAYWTSAGFPSLLGSVATGTISNGTGISVTAGQRVIGSGLTITNTAPDQTVAFTNGTGISVTGTYPNFTVTNTAPLTFSYPFIANATSTLIDFSGGIKIGTLDGLIAGNSGNIYAAATSTLNIGGTAASLSAILANTLGGTGQNSSAWNGLAAINSGVWSQQATTSASCSGTVSCTQFTVLGASPITITGSGGGTSAFEIATTSDIAVSNLAYFTKTSGRTTLGGSATSTLTISGPFTYPTIYAIGASAAITYTGLATTSQPTSSNLLVSNGGAGVYGAATTTPTFGLGLTGGGTWTVLGSAPTLNVATSSFYSGTTGQFPYFSGTNTLTATSSIFLAAGGNVGVGTTTPYIKFSVGGDVVVGASTAGGTLGNLYLPTLGTAAGTFVAADPSGKLIATTTPGGSGGTTVTTGYATSTGTGGYLTMPVSVVAGDVVNWEVHARDFQNCAAAGGLVVNVDLLQSTFGTATTTYDRVNNKINDSTTDCSAVGFASFTATTTETVWPSLNVTSNTNDIEWRSLRWTKIHQN